MFHVCLCYAVLAVPCRACDHLLEKGWLLGSRVCVMFSCVFVTFPNGDSGKVCYLIASIPALCLFPY